MRTLIDGNDDIIITEEIDVPSPLLNTLVVDPTVPPWGVRESRKEVGVEEVDSLGSLFVGALEVVLKETHVQGDQVIVQEVIPKYPFTIAKCDLGLLLSISRIHQRFLPFVPEIIISAK